MWFSSNCFCNSWGQIQNYMSTIEMVFSSVKVKVTTWFVFSVVVAASLHWAGFVLLRELWVTEDQRNPFTLQFTYVHHNPRVEGDFSWQFIKFLSIFVKPVTNSKYVFHVQVKGNQNQICESEDQKSLQYNILRFRKKIMK